MATPSERRDGPPMLAPITLNSATNHTSAAVKKANHRPSLLDPSSLIRSFPSALPSTFTMSDIEPPPPMPAAMEESGYLARPDSSHSIRRQEHSDDGGYSTPPRPGSMFSEVTVAWDASPGRYSDSGPSTNPKAKRRMGGFFTTNNNPSSTSVDYGDDDGVDTPIATNRPSYFPSQPVISTAVSAGYSTGDETETPIAPKKSGFFSKLKSLGSVGVNTGSHARSPSGWTMDSGEDPNSPWTPVAQYSPAMHGITDEEEPDLYGERRPRSPGTPEGSRTVPASPRLSYGPRRRATITNLPEEAQEAIANASRPSSRPPYSRRTSFRRMTQFHHRRSSHDADRPSGGSSAGGQTSAKWRALKANLKAMGKKKEESKIDREKSAELVAELTAATPAAVILASMFQRDEHGNKRIPILLEQLKVKILDSKTGHKGGIRAHTVFIMELEYGSGLTRMKWTVQREFRDFINLHSRYRLADISNTTFGGREAYKLPKFPRATIPYLRGVRGLGSEDEDADAEGSGNETSTTANPTQSPSKKKRALRHRKSSGTGDELGIATGMAAGIGTLTAAVAGASSQALTRREGFAIRQRQQLEDYLRKLIRIMIFRPDSNRLCKFLELSALGVRLAAEGSYHGKEGYLIIRSSKGSDYRRVWNPATMAKRHSPKWFLVRHSYLVCVDSPEEMNIYDVFLVDSNFAVDAKKFMSKQSKDLTVPSSSHSAHTQHHSLTVQNSERQLKLLAKNERQLLQFHESIRYMSDHTDWAKEHRFESFAPIRRGVFAQWLVDGRDYFWNVSRAISMAKDVIYIHDWWLSPELYLRRPAAVSQKWRLDRLLQSKAQEGVKIFVIVYRNIGAAVPIDSQYTKYSLLDLHPNVFVQRSPNQIRQATFFWAHHEKILIVDHMVAFVGGIDLCFGRWDTPQHCLSDDKPTGFEQGSSKDDPDNFQLWPGKDYSNPRVQDFFQLDKPYEEMYDRTKVPRMPWHDIHMQIVGQPARDLTRHFIQRWNYLLRQRTPSRPTPVLLPPPDFTPAELESLGINGTCEVQILRSACSWSLGTPNLTECSIMNAYIKSIETSEHFVYIENQFFITSCEWAGTVIENKIGDALVERIIRAYKNEEEWRAIVVLPLMPGFQNTVDAQDGTSVRLIMQCQYRSISRGESSIFGRLRQQGIEPEAFIQFYGLRNWGKIGPGKVLVTEQLYIHAKCMVVDDRIAIIGSANINERSMLGNRDSEVAAIVRDADTLVSTMAGKPFRVGKFPHTLRLRLMREHLGLDVDEIMANERMEESMKSGGCDHGVEDHWEDTVKKWQEEQDNMPDGDPEYSENIRSPSESNFDRDAVLQRQSLRSFNHDVDWEEEGNPHIMTPSTPNDESIDSRVVGNPEHEKDVKGYGPDRMKEKEEWARVMEKGKAPFDVNNVQNSRMDRGSRPTTAASPNPPKHDSPEPSSRGSTSAESGNAGLPPPPGHQRIDSEELGLPQTSQPPPVSNDRDVGGPDLNRSMSFASTGAGKSITRLHELKLPKVDPNMLMDPLDDSFFMDVWHTVAQDNTKIYRQVFRCMPDNEVKTWSAYKEYTAYAERFAQSMTGEKTKARKQHETPGKAFPNGSESPNMNPVNEEKFGSIGERVGTNGAFRQQANNNAHSQEELERTRGDDISFTLNDKNEFRPVDQQSIRPRSTSHASSRLNTANTSNTSNTAATSGKPNSRGSQESGKPSDQHPLSSKIGSISHDERKNIGDGPGSTSRRRRGTTRSSKRDFHASDDMMDKDSAERLLNITQGHLVVWPYDWLIREEEAGNWLYSIDQLAPIEI
ncbi:Phospholipase D1 [Rhizina undulata]